MRNVLATLLNIAGLCLLVTAAVVAWNIYQPEALPPVPADVSVDAQAPSPPTPLPSGTLPAGAPTTSASPGAPLLLPAEPTLAAIVVLPPTQPDPVSGNDTSAPARPTGNPEGDLAATRASGFPPPADSLPTRIVLPSIKVDSKVVEVGWKTTLQNGQLFSEWEVADYAVGFLKNGALPGAAGNTVMAGHNNINGEVFKNLIDLKLGDDILVYAGQTAYRYVVKQKLLLKEAGVPLEQRLQNAQWIAPTNDVRLTLVSCWPYTSNTHRVIIVATPAT